LEPVIGCAGYGVKRRIASDPDSASARNLLLLSAQKYYVRNAKEMANFTLNPRDYEDRPARPKIFEMSITASIAGFSPVSV